MHSMHNLIYPCFTLNCRFGRLSVLYRGSELYNTWYFLDNVIVADESFLGEPYD